MAGDLPIPGDPGLAPLHLFTDAACQRHDRFQVSAWAAMLLVGNDTHFRAGLLQSGITESLDAELLAVAFSLECLLLAGCVRPLATLVVHTDNQSAVHLLNGTTRPRPTMQRAIAALEHIARMVADENLTLSAAWVKSHQGYDTKCWRGLINARVDKEARRIARHHRAVLEKAAQEVQAA